MPDFDLFVIGGGSGGVACARRAASHGAKVGLAEHSRVGGTCVIRGCVPKKLMHYGAHFAEWFKAAKFYGWEIGDPGAGLRAPVRGPQRRDRAAQRHLPADARARRRAPVPGPRPPPARRNGEAFVVQAAAEQVTAARVLVAVGARPALPEIPGIELALTSDQVLEDVYPLPERLAVVGAGYIGLELASIFNGLGAHTTLILRGDLPLRGFEHDLRQHLTVEVEGHGVCSVERDPGRADRAGRGGLQLVTTRGPLEVDAVIYATGRSPVPQTGGSAWRPTPSAANATGTVAVDTAYRSSKPGHLRRRRLQRSCRHRAGRHAVRPHAGRDRRGPGGGRAAVQRQPGEVNYATIPTAVFALPQAATVGLSEAKARALGPRAHHLPHQLPADVPHAHRHDPAHHDEAGGRPGHATGSWAATW